MDPQPNPSATTPITGAPPPPKKSGTSVIKASSAQPPKETARITVKPSLPGRKSSRILKPAAPGAAAPATSGPAVKPKVVTTVPQPAAPTATAPAVKAPSAAPIRFEESEEEAGSPLMTGIAAGLAVVMWVTAAFLFASLFDFI
ncbi:MAG TPA: hypothetical protein VL981_03975 [Candidatus Methylacidiphilales bacterium]|nr:hypothetical protein [Candidatus Methylacidiphilales bacterium]